MSTFKDQYSFEQRLAESKKIMSKFPEKYPTIVEISNNDLFRSVDLPGIDKKKYLISDIALSNFIFILRKKMQLKSETAIYLLVNGNISPPSSEMISVLYNKYKDEDGFLYITVAPENFFGA
jgi:GABA(A) receptor-associated protein